MLKIRLQRVGRTNNPSFRLVVTEKTNATRSGRAIEVLGSYDARGGAKGAKPALKADRITYWISKGAQPTGSVHNLLISEKIITGKKVNVLPRKSPPKPAVDPKAAVSAAPATTEPAAEAAPTAAPVAA